MTYEQAIDFLYHLRFFGMKLGLENTRRLAAAAGDPQRKLRFVHVAGTNGKGSTCAMLESIYRSAGYRTGLFTSPHLVSFGERIQVNRRLLPERDVVRLTTRIQELMESSGVSATFFEAVTLMALLYFSEQQCDLVIWETGLGGRLDATNIVTPLACLITNIQLDHQQWLGNTIPEIAREKAGIIKPGIPVLTSAADPDALCVIKEVAAQQHAPLTIIGPADADAAHGFELSLSGDHQRWNAALALATVRILQGQMSVPVSALGYGLKTTQWGGRLQRVVRPGGHLLLVDCAHNPAGADTLARALQAEFADRRPALILGTMADKDYTAIARILVPLASKIFVAPVASLRGVDPALLGESCRQAHPQLPVTICQSLRDALTQTASEPFTVLTGSIQFVGEAIEAVGQSEPPRAEGALNDYYTPVQAVTFDVGGTLIEPWPSVGAVYSEVAAGHGIVASPADLDRQFAAAWKAKQNFGYRLSDWSELVNATFAGLADPPPGGQFFSDLYAHFATSKPWHIFPDVLPRLKALKAQGLKLGIISNWDDRLRPLLRALDLEQYFDTITVSSEEGVHKPEPQIFARAATRLGLPPSAVLHIGDSPKEDVEGARAAGFQARLLRRSQGDTL